MRGSSFGKVSSFWQALVEWLSSLLTRSSLAVIGICAGNLPIANAFGHPVDTINTTIVFPHVTEFGYSFSVKHILIFDKPSNANNPPSLLNLRKDEIFGLVLFVWGFR